MTDIIHVPLSKLALWDGNVRKTGIRVGIEELAASIAAHGLLQSLVSANRSAASTASLPDSGACWRFRRSRRTALSKKTARSPACSPMARSIRRSSA